MEEPLEKQSSSHSTTSVKSKVCIVIAIVCGLLPGWAVAQTVASKDDVGVNVAVMDPHTVSDVFGKRIAQRFIALQVTIRNKSSDHQFLIHDVSLDLEKVFPAGYFEQRDLEECQQRLSKCKTKNELLTKDRRQPCHCDDARHRYELSSLELSLLRGVAKKPGEVR